MLMSVHLRVSSPSRVKAQPGSVCPLPSTGKHSPLHRRREGSGEAIPQVTIWAGRCYPILPTPSVTRYLIRALGVPNCLRNRTAASSHLSR